MAKKQTISSEISSAPSSPAPRTETPKAKSTTKRATTTKHAKAKVMPAAETKVPDATVVAAPVTMNRDEVAKVAYLYWEARGYRGGSPEEDWVRAEHEVRGRLTLAAKA
jgi:hypothetical protein